MCFDKPCHPVGLSTDSRTQLHCNAVRERTANLQSAFGGLPRHGNVVSAKVMKAWPGLAEKSVFRAQRLLLLASAGTWHWPIQGLRLRELRGQRRAGRPTQVTHVGSTIGACEDRVSAATAIKKMQGSRHCKGSPPIVLLQGYKILGKRLKVEFKKGEAGSQRSWNSRHWVAVRATTERERQEIRGSSRSPRDQMFPRQRRSTS